MVTERQIAAMKYMIFKAKNGTELSKRVLAFLLDRSNGLEKEVCLTLVDGREGFTADEISDAALGVGAMLSCNCTTHLDGLTELAGSELSFSIHYGDFDPNRIGDPFSCAGQFSGLNRSQVSRPELLREKMPLRYTFWLSRESYSRQAELVSANREKLEQIDLTKPGLYPELERARTTN